MDTMDRRIEKLLDHFDFDKVHKTMKALNWKWRRVDSIPEIADLRSCARRLLHDCAKTESAQSTGGFSASYINNELTLEFIVEEMYESFYEGDDR